MAANTGGIRIKKLKHGDGGAQVVFRAREDIESRREDWCGVTDPTERRKLQNRLNQRAARKRKLESGKKGRSGELTPLTVSQQTTRNSLPPESRVLLDDLLETKEGRDEWRLLTDHEALVVVKRFTAPPTFQLSLAEFLYRKCASHLPADHLLSLVYYNVFRALASNITLLKLDFERVCNDVYPSTFTTADSCTPEKLKQIPPDLHPTPLQRSLEHHAVFDVFPDPVLRDNFLIIGEENIDDEGMALDLVGDGTFTGDEGGHKAQGLMVWGEPWDVKSWEMSEGFVSKYSWLLVGAQQFLDSTNEHRRRRGEPPVSIDVNGAPLLPPNNREDMVRKMAWCGRATRQSEFPEISLTSSQTWSSSSSESSPSTKLQ